MKQNLITPKRSLNKEMEKLLNEQIVMEGKSSASYLSMASWCETKGYNNSAEFLYKHSDEERGHMLKLFKYVNQAGGHALQPEISDIQHTFKSLRKIFEDVLEHEIQVTKSIHEIVCFLVYLCVYCVCVSVGVCVSLCVYMCMCVRMCINDFLSIYLYLCVFVCVCVYVIPV